jgi:hypothetical protein
MFSDDAVRVVAKFGRASVNTIAVPDGLKQGGRIFVSHMSAWATLTGCACRRSIYEAHFLCLTYELISTIRALV